MPHSKNPAVRRPAVERPAIRRPAVRRLAVRRPAVRHRARIDGKAYLYVLPALLVFIAFIGIPLGQTVWYSFWNWNGLSVATWAGFDNYLNIGTDGALLASFIHTLVLLLFYAVIPVAIALALTAIMGRASRMRGVSGIRTLLFLPQVVPSVVVATVWISIYSPVGLLNQVLRLVGVHDASLAWLGTVSTALPAVGIIGSWLGIGLCIVLFVSGATSIPVERYESARLDGAGIVREFFSITLPGLRGHIAVALTLTAVAALKSFDLVYVTTRGGPGTATTVPAYDVYNRAFVTNQVGQAAAIAIALTVVILVVTVVISKIQPSEDDE